MSLTAEQRAAAFAGDAAIAVVAGAGTGKTRVLTERYLHLVLDRGVEIPRVLAVTFTEKAAREMKQRIRDALKDRHRADLAWKVEFAPISTVHAFLARTLRERALDAGLDPRFAIADEIAADVLLEQAVADTIDGLDDDAREPLLALQGGEDALRGLYLAARATPLPIGDLRAVEPDLDALRERTEAFLAMLPEPDGLAAGTAAKVRGLRDLAPGLRALDPAAGEEFKRLVGGNVAQAAREAFDFGKTLRDEWVALRLLETARATGTALCAALVELDRRYLAAKRAEGLLDFADLEREGLRLLSSPAGEAVAREYDHLLVDEYQDTSRIQQALLDRLATRAARFGVGDEKQSIYRFRYADAAVFRELQDDATRLPLSGSFRSRPELVEFVNGLFRGLFAGRDVEPQDLRAEARWGEKAEPCVEVVAVRAGRAADARRVEARTLARRLRAIVEEERPTTTRVVEGREPRPLKYGDCALLLRATTHLTEYERALADEGVPYVVVKGRGYYAAREVVDLAHLLVLLSDPLDHWRAVGVLNSLLAGVPEAVLVQAGPPTEGEGPWPLLVRRRERPAGVAPELWARWEQFAERFARWRELAGRVPTGDLVETILEETRFADLLLLEPDGRRRHANLAKALRRARQGNEDPASFARALLEFRDRERRESEAPITDASGDAVQVMTVHAAKGLEFPLVAVADLGGGTRPGSGPILAPDGTIGFRLRAEEGGEGSLEPPGLAHLKAWERDQEENERLRLLYVALTRAEEHLILAASFGDRRGGGKGPLDDFFAQPPPGLRVVDPVPRGPRDAGRTRAAEIRGALRRAAPMPPGLERDDEGAASLLERIDGIARRPRDDTPYLAAVADLLEFDRCPRRYRLARMLGIEIEDGVWEGHTERADADEHPRRLLGTVFHELAAEVGPAGVPDEDAIRAKLPDATPGDVARLLEWHGWLAGLPLAREAAADAKHEREMAFVATLAGLPVRGVIDLFAPGVPLLADYKTSSTVRAEEYGVQVAIYLAALASLGLPAPPVAHLIYVDAREVVEIGPAPVEPPVDAFIAAHRNGGGFAPAPGAACRFCDFRAACEADGLQLPA